MLSFLLKKMIYLLTTLFVIATVTFFLMRSIPGDPFRDEKALPKEIHQSLREFYGLNDPLHQQYIRYLSAISHFDFGPSLKYKGRMITEIIREAFPVSFILGLEAILLALTAGLILGTIGALNYNKWIDSTSLLLIIFCISVPNFALASFLQYIFAIQLKVLPVARWGTFAHSILPAISLGCLPAAFIAGLIRKQMIDVLQQDYIKTAKSKGLSDTEIIFKHVFRNALLPLIAYLGQLTANILVGSFIIEKIFAIPGLGQWFVKSILNRDYTAIMGLTIFYGTLLVSSIFIFDLLSMLIDPRLKNHLSTRQQNYAQEV